MAKQTELTIDDVLEKFSFEEIQAAQKAKEQRLLQPRKDKVLADFATLKKEVDAIRELDKDFAFPWKSSKKSAGGRILGGSDILRIQEAVKDESKQLKEIAKVLGVHPLRLKKYLKDFTDYKISTKNNKAFVSYKPAK